MNFPQLLAKSRKKDEEFIPSMLLPVHLRDVHDSAARVLDATQDDQLNALGLPVDVYRTRLRRIVLLAAAVHDLGKANDHFQSMIYRQRDVRVHPQGLRHEWVTLLMMQQLREWLLPAIGGSDLDLSFVEWIVAGHHPAHDHANPPRLNPAGGGATIHLLMGHDDFGAALAWLAETFDLPDPDSLPTKPRNLVGSANVFVEIASWFRKSQLIWDEVRKTPDGRLVAAAKNALIGADVAGSAIPKNGESHDWSWIGKSLNHKPDAGELQRVAEHRLDGRAPRPFQLAVPASPLAVTYVKAGCGTGKTVAAYLWAAAKYPTRRLFICYPTTGTATEGFKDYLFQPEGELGDLGAKLFHSRRDVDHEIVLATEGDTKSADVDAANRLEALEAWSTPIVACTVDTVLGLVQNNKRGRFSWPALAQSAFVFDEIHAYDDRLFGALLRFLRDLPGLPALLMTASLPNAREAALRETLKSRQIELNPISGPHELESLPRYRKAITPNYDPLPFIRETLAKGEKVLWVCNTVGRVMDAADRTTDLGRFIYHSRFKYEDRVERHKEVIAAFQGKEPALAICSQVAEMSLDLSADLLVTDLAPVPALIQRLGRLNRRASRLADPTKPMIVIEPDGHLPYTPPDLDKARTWLGALPTDDISQRQLAEKWEQAGDQAPQAVVSAWLDGGPATTVSELREASPGVTVLMEEDKPRVVANPRHLSRLLIPMPPPPRGLDWRLPLRFRGLPVARTGTIHYEKKQGAQWQR